MKLKFIEHNEAQEEKTKYERDIYEIGNYRVIRDLSIYESGRVYESFDIRPNRELEYIPDIYFNNRLFGDDFAKEFKIQTTAYGSMSPEIIQQIIEGYKEAIEVVNILTDKFLKSEE